MEQSIFSSFSHFLQRLVVLISFFVFAASVSATTIIDDFEGIGGVLPNGETEFSIGPATFSGGISGIAGIRELYNSGNHAWMIKGGQTGIIQFGPNVIEASFYARTSSAADASSIITAFDAADNTLESLTLNPGDSFVKFSVSGLIDRIEYVNNDSDSNRMNALDDFSITVVPVPAAIWFFGTALLSTFGFSRLKKTFLRLVK